MFANLDQKVIEKIKKESMAPKPRWHFLLKEGVIWLFGALSLFVGAAAVAMMIYLSKNSDLMMHAELGHSFVGYLFLSLPYFWLLFLALFLWVLFYNIKHSKRGYHYSVYLIVLAAVLASVIVGFAFSFLGVGQDIDDVLARQAPLYDSVFNPHVGMWSRAEEGRLAGLVISRPDESHFILLDRDSGEWYVAQITDADKDIDNNLIVVGQPLRVMGEVIGDHEFRAKKIFPVKPGREFFKRLQPHDMMMDPSKDFEGMPRGFGPGKMMFNDEAQLNKLRITFEESPELKAIFEDNLMDNDKLFADMIKQNPNLIRNLKDLNISEELLQKIR
ncbi:MAG: hypothetical protein PHE20_02485 [Patescibacteria group bacterium]|nr:hypothetical protein [Patescibacteria group bacterium]